jgi:hypothetical protein
VARPAGGSAAHVRAASVWRVRWRRRGQQAADAGVRHRRMADEGRREGRMVAGGRLEAARAAGEVAHRRGRPKVQAAGEGRWRGRTTESRAAGGAARRLKPSVFPRVAQQKTRRGRWQSLLPPWWSTMQFPLSLSLSLPGTTAASCLYIPSSFFSIVQAKFDYCWLFA